MSWMRQSAESLLSDKYSKDTRDIYMSLCKLHKLLAPSASALSLFLFLFLLLFLSQHHGLSKTNLGGSSRGG